MYTEKDRDARFKKRSFKFINRTGQVLKRSLQPKDDVAKEKAEQAKQPTKEVQKVEFNWPKELMAIMN